MKFEEDEFDDEVFDNEFEDSSDSEMSLLEDDEVSPEEEAFMRGYRDSG